MKKITILGMVALVVVMALAIAAPVAAGGLGGKGSVFDEFGYNYQARVFVGPADGVDRALDGSYYTYGPFYANDHMVMKWSKGWDDATFGPDGIKDTEDELDWTPEAWETVVANGMVPGGSQEVWHYKIIWVGPDLEDSPYWREGGYPIWGQFEVIMSQGVVGSEHIWETLATPCGFGGSLP